MQILYIATSFPKPEKGATIYTDLAEALHEAGHRMTVAVSERPGESRPAGIEMERGIEVLRIVTGNFYNVGFLRKGITTLKIPILMKNGIKRYLGGRTFDFILFEAPPVTNSDLIAWSKEYFRCPAYLMLKDIFPQNAADLGIIRKNSLLYHYFTKKEYKLYRTADYIGCMSPANKQYILDHNPWIDPGKVELFPNTKRLTNDLKPEGQPSMRAKFGIPEKACVFLFGGNMGRPQFIELLCTAIRECKEEKDIFFLFVGRGSDRWKLQRTIEQESIGNALVLDDMPRELFEQIVKEIDVGLIILDPRFTIPNFPSRILTYLEYAKPVLAATDTVTDIQELIQDARCGEWVWSGDEGAFVDKVKEMSRRTDLSVSGINGRLYIERNFQVAHSVAVLENHFK